MDNKEKIKVTVTVPGEDETTFEVDYIIASLVTDEDDKVATNLINCGGVTKADLFKAWSMALISAIKGLDENAKSRSVLYGIAKCELMNMIQKKDPDVLDASGKLFGKKFAKELWENIRVD